MIHFVARSTDLCELGPGLEIQVAVSAGMEEALAKAGRPVPPPHLVDAIIDTAADVTVIDMGLPEAIGLHPKGSTNLNTPGGDIDECTVYDARLLFPNDGVWHGEVVEAPIRDSLNVRCIIGRDLLAHAVFVYIGRENLFTLSLAGSPAEAST